LLLDHLPELSILGLCPFLEVELHLADLLFLRRLFRLFLVMLLLQVLNLQISLLQHLLQRLELLVKVCLQIVLHLTLNLRLHVVLSPVLLELGEFCFLILFLPQIISLCLYPKEVIQRTFDLPLNRLRLASQLTSDFLLELIDKDLVLLDGEVGFGHLLGKGRGGLVLLHLERVALSLQSFQLLLQRDKVLLVLVNDLLAYFPEEITFLRRDSCLDLHLTKFFLEKLILLDPYLTNVEVWVSTLVVVDEVAVTREKLGALVALR